MQSVTLIIDKRRELSVKYKKLLENEQLKVIVSKNFISAMKIIQDKEPDLIIISDSIDNDLGDYCKKIRALTYNMRPVIVALSKSSEIQDRLNALANGADDFLSEPVNNEEFVMRIKAHLRREFESYLDMLSNEEIINYRDCYGGTILHDMAEANLTTDYFEKIIDRIGEYNFIELLETRDRGGNYAISNVQNLELFKYLVSYSGIDDRMLRRISQFCSQPILTYLADIINDAILFDD